MTLSTSISWLNYYVRTNQLKFIDGEWRWNKNGHANEILIEETNDDPERVSEMFSASITRLHDLTITE